MRLSSSFFCLTFFRLVAETMIKGMLINYWHTAIRNNHEEMKGAKKEPEKTFALFVSSWLFL
jgi:hypothetical protein